MKQLRIVFVEDPERRERVADTILQALPDWFGLPESTRAYVEQCRELPLWVAMLRDEAIGFVSMRATSPQTAEVHCMGVLPTHHRQGIGKRLMAALEGHACRQGYRLLQVKTVDQGHYPAYDRTILFYEGVGFMRLEVFPTLWDEWNPCLVLLKPLHPVTS